MIAARTLKSKEAIDELVDSGENMEDIEIAASNAEKALNSIGLTARTQTGDFKDLEVILGEVAAKVDWLNWLSYGQTFGIDNPFVLNMNVLTLTFAFALHINIASIIGMAIAIFLYRKAF